MTEQNTQNRVLMPIVGTIGYADMLRVMLPLMTFQSPRITLFHVVETPVTTPLDAESLSEVVERVKAEKTKPIAEWLASNGYEVDTKIAVARKVADAIVEETQQSEYSFVFMMKRRRREGLRGLLSRSVTDEVVRRAECPVVSVFV
jgi:nucleotide-binding universal stress UspA family protein